jgi:DNA-binding MarR family transcriptional regulator
MSTIYSSGIGVIANPITIIFTDSVAGAASAEASVVAIGGRVGASLGIADGVKRINEQVFVNAILLDISHDHGVKLDQLLDRLDRAANDDQVPTIASVPFALIDTVTARLSSAHVTILCEPDPVERIVALASALEPRQRTFQDVSTEIESIRFKRLADEMARMARTLSSLTAADGARPAGSRRAEDATQLNEVATRFNAEPASLFDRAPLVAGELRNMLQLRRLRSRYFDAELFADPAWDMLLDLMAAHLDGDKVAVSSLCIAADVPATTALRWIKTMTDNGLFEREADPLDGRRIFIGLSERAVKAMTAYFCEAKRANGMMV